ncbi:polysaccharide lyase family 1 protein [Arcticibacter sp.]|jgi:hypothetical protein|uniref:pectate lyase family protein n=1 Tax=Arcticibacter sp. TaxID=1872630 RepID=UPI00389052D1
MATYSTRIFCITLVFLAFTLPLQAQQIAFPGAEGYGKFTTGGRGGRVIEVTNLKGDESPGSLRAALNTPGSDPITIVFRISGNISLTNGQVKVGRSNMTIAGQTAPGGGICIKDGYLKFSGSNLIIRFMRFRPGDASGLSDLSCLGNENSQNVIIDHCSLSWSNEESHTCYDNKYITVQWCILSESLYKSFDSKGARSYAAQWGGQYATYHHNLIASNASRSPRVNGSRSHDTVAVCDYRNNVIYNWGKSGAVYGGELEVNDPNARCYVNWVNNYYKPGPATASDLYFVQPSYESRKGAAKGYAKWYLDGNVMEGTDGSLNSDNWKGVDASKVGSAENIRSMSEFHVERPFTETAGEAYKSVLANAGAIFPERDKVDKRVVNEASGKLKPSGSGAYGQNKGIIDTQKSVGGWPELKSSKAPVDLDHDGMADDWEIKNKLNPNNVEDRNIVADDGYTMLEKYINSLVV